jgi:hypothetical protein
MLKNVNEEMTRFAKYVVSQSRANLTRGKKNVTRVGYDSIGYDLNVSKNSFGLDFKMESYLVFQDRGVKGTVKGKSLSNFSYKPSSNVVGMEYHTGKFAKWAKFRGLQFRNKKGQFTSFKQTGFMLANIIKKNGIKPSLFFTTPFTKAVKERLPKDITNAFRLDVDDFLKATTKDNLKKK